MTCWLRRPRSWALFMGGIPGVGELPRGRCPTVGSRSSDARWGTSLPLGPVHGECTARAGNRPGTKGVHFIETARPRAGWAAPKAPAAMLQAPMTRVCSISAVFDGPLTQVRWMNGQPGRGHRARALVEIGIERPQVEDHQDGCWARKQERALGEARRAEEQRGVRGTPRPRRRAPRGRRPAPAVRRPGLGAGLDPAPRSAGARRPPGSPPPACGRRVDHRCDRGGDAGGGDRSAVAAAQRPRARRGSSPSSARGRPRSHRTPGARQARRRAGASGARGRPPHPRLGSLRSRCDSFPAAPTRRGSTGRCGWAGRACASTARAASAAQADEERPHAPRQPSPRRRRRAGCPAPPRRRAWRTAWPRAGRPSPHDAPAPGQELVAEVDPHRADVGAAAAQGRGAKGGCARRGCRCALARAPAPIGPGMVQP